MNDFDEWQLERSIDAADEEEEQMTNPNQPLTDEELREQFVNAMHDYYGVENDNDLAVYGMYFDDVVKPLLQAHTLAARQQEVYGMIMLRYDNPKLHARDEAVDEWLKNRLAQLTSDGGGE